MDAFAVTYPLHGALEYLPRMELAVLRRGDLILSAKGGFNDESHNHNDVGSFSLHEGALPILIDVGIGTYTRQTFSAERYSIPWVCSTYHNLPLINGVEQRAGEKYRADRFIATEEGITVSYPKAYPAEAGVTTLTRSLTLTEATLTVTDRACFADGAKREITEVLMCILPVEIQNGEAIIDGRFRVRAAGGTVRTESIPFSDKNLEGSWRSTHTNRILIDFKDTDEIIIEVEKI
jgi:hypothetical protein